MSDLQELAQSWLDRVDSDPCQVVYQALYKEISATVAASYKGDPKRRWMLVVGAGYGADLRLFLDLPWCFVAVEKYPEIAKRLRYRLAETSLDVGVIDRDFLDYADWWTASSRQRFHLTSMILTTQYMDPDYLQRVLNRLYSMTDRLILDVTNPRSVYGLWTRIRGWRGRDVHYYTPAQIEAMLEEAGFNVLHTKGFGVASPLSLFRGYRGTVVRPWMTRALRFLDRLFPRMGHIYYMDCRSDQGRIED